MSSVHTKPSGTRKKPRRRQKTLRLREKSLFLLLIFVFFLGAFCSYVMFNTPLPAKITRVFSIHVSTEDSVQDQSHSNQSSLVSNIDFAENTPNDAAQNPTAHDQAKALLGDMSLEEKIYQMFIVTQEQLTGFQGTVTQSGETSINAIQDYPVGGIIYFEENLIDPDQVTAMIGNLQQAAKIKLFISVDEEGGRVSRLGKNDHMNVTQFSSMMEIGSQGEEAVKNATSTIGRELLALGFNLDFAPVADVFTNPENTVIGDRALSTDPATAAALIPKAVEGFRESGILCTLKHFPGHGDTAADSHSGAVYLNGSLEKLEQSEFLPFRAGIEAGADMVMVGHICTPDITGDVPASLSSEMVTNILRNRLGFKGVVVTDAMNMSAITSQYDSASAAVNAIQAGVDIILIPSDFHTAYQGVFSAVQDGRLSENRIDESVIRILETKIRQGIISTT